MNACPCGAGSSLDECCGPYLDGKSQPETALTLMRARYTAHTVGNMSYILKTHHPATRTDIDENATAKWAKESEWLGLEIISSEGGDTDDDEGRIEFMAKYRDAQRQRHTHHELGVFEKHHGQWFFKDAELPDVKPFRHTSPKQGRNDPCACGSGKKFKKCCGAA